MSPPTGENPIAIQVEALFIGSAFTVDISANKRIAEPHRFIARPGLRSHFPEGEKEDAM
ncbi:MAG: hypothetical protein ACKVUS_00355 [Saprospiraceae bacterium]